jgi:hypothetical protein
MCRTSWTRGRKMVNVEMLKFAIVENACKDYEWSLRYLNRLDHVGLTLTEHQRQKVEKARILLSESENFFRSDWFKIICELNGESLMRNLRQRALTEKRTITRGRIG